VKLTHEKNKNEKYFSIKMSDPSLLNEMYWEAVTDL